MNISSPTVRAIRQAAECLEIGALVAFPTETVYGAGADATQDKAVARVFAAKDRPRFNPLIVHVAGLEAAGAHTVLTPLAEQLAARFWPGPLTMVLKRLPQTPVSLLASAGHDSMAVRAPDHPVARQLIAAFGKRSWRRRPIAPAMSHRRRHNMSPKT